MNDTLASALRALIHDYRAGHPDPTLRAYHFAILALALHDEDAEIIDGMVQDWIRAHSNAAILRGDDPEELTHEEALQYMIEDMSAALLYA